MIIPENIISIRLFDLLNWSFSNNALVKNFVFNDFVTALTFINAVGLIAEKLKHHPEIHNVYNKVQLSLNTHDAGGVTELDFELAIAIDSIS